jgi:hypothetical protein
MSQIKSKERVANHGEVFTPPHLVKAILDLVSDEAQRIDSRFLEPACGSGNFLVEILQRKLATVQKKYGKNDFEKRNFSLFSIMSIYGVELLEDNTSECRANLARVFAKNLNLEDDDELLLAATYVLSQNIINGDALTMTLPSSDTDDDGKPILGEPICFAEWGYIGKGKFQRRDFRYSKLENNSLIHEEGSLWDYEDSDLEIYAAETVYEPMTIKEISSMPRSGGN